MFICFFVLSSAVKYLVEPLDKSFIDVAERLIKIFQKMVPRFYGEAAQTFNVHSLGHLADQVKTLGFLVLHAFGSCTLSSETCYWANYKCILSNKIGSQEESTTVLQVKI